MAKNDERYDIEVKKTDTIVRELDRLQQVISRRAYELFQHGGAWGDAVTDWLTAERELVSKPAVELRQKDGHFEVLAALPGLDAKDLDVQITPEALLIKAEMTHEHSTEAGTVHVCEFDGGEVFRSIHFPEAIDPKSAKAEFRRGMLRLTVAVKKTENPQKVAIKAA